MNIEKVMLLYTHVAGPHSFVPNKDAVLVLVDKDEPARFVKSISFMVEDEEAFLVFDVADKEDAVWYKRELFDGVARVDVYKRVDK